MRRTQLAFDDDLWGTRQRLAKSQQTTISELVRTAVREQYFGNQGQRLKAMQAFVGIRKGSIETADAAEMVRGLRRGDRVKRI